jgi:putative flippase GtrA
MVAFVRFGIVGVAGFVVDAATLALMMWLGAGLYLGRVCSYLAAATCTWALNRNWTFRDIEVDGNRFTQWARFLAANSVGGAINYGAYSLILSGYHSNSLALPVLAVAIGSITGWAINFILSRYLVFGRV